MSALFNDAVISAADTVARAVWRDFFAIRGQGAEALAAIAAAGKSHFVMDTVKKCRRRDMRVAVAAATNEQAFRLVSSIARNEPTRPVAFIPAGEVELPAWANVRVISPAHRASREPVVVGTIVVGVAPPTGGARLRGHFHGPAPVSWGRGCVLPPRKPRSGRCDLAFRHARSKGAGGGGSAPGGVGSAAGD
jgi:hypothetical protein